MLRNSYTEKFRIITNNNDQFGLLENHVMVIAMLN